MAKGEVNSGPKLGPATFVTAGIVTAGLAAFGLFAATGGYERLSLEARGVVEDDIVRANDAPEERSADGPPLDLLANPIEQPEETAIPPKPPEIELLRVEPDGSAIVAGTAEPGSTVELNSGGKKLAETTVGSSGQYAIVLDKPLEPGDHALGVSSTDKSSGEMLPSSSIGIVKVPKDANSGQPSVLISREDRPLEIVQRDKTRKLTESEDQAIASAQSDESIAVAGQKPDAQTEEKDAEQQIAVLDEEPQGKPEAELAEDISVLLEAADIEANEIFIAGTGKPGALVDLYLDGFPIGSARVKQNGSFLFEGRRELQLGRYPLRADMVDPGSGKVIARAEVDLLYQPPPSQKRLVEQEEGVKPTFGGEPAPETEIAIAPAQQAVPTPSNKSVGESINTETRGTDVEATGDDAITLTDNGIAPSQDGAGAMQGEQEQSDTKTLVTGTAVIIRSGDSLWRVARRNYGRGIRYTTIFDANRDQIRDPRLIYPGQVLRVPKDGEDG